MRGCRKILFAIALAIQAGCTFAAAPPIKRRGEPGQIQRMTVVQPVAVARAAILRALHAAHGKRRYRLIIPFGAPLFPSDEDLALSGAAQPVLGLWLALPAAERRKYFINKQ